MLSRLPNSIFRNPPLEKVEPKQPLRKVEPKQPLRNVEPKQPLRKVEPNYLATPFLKVYGFPCKYYCKI